MTQFDVIILVWDNFDISKKCIEKIAHFAQLETSYIIVDNGSSPENKEKLLSLFNKNATILFNNKNKGFAGGVNQAIKLSTAPYVFLLNNDVMWKEPWGEGVIKEFQNDKNLGLLGFGEVFKKDRIQKHLGFNGLKWNGDINAEFDLISGHVMFISRAVIDRVGLFDEQFFPGLMEDCDYSLRVKQAGFSIKNLKADFEHLGNSTLYKKFSPDEVKNIVADTSRRFFRKHFSNYLMKEK